MSTEHYESLDEAAWRMTQFANRFYTQGWIMHLTIEELPAGRQVTRAIKAEFPNEAGPPREAA